MPVAGGHRAGGAALREVDRQPGVAGALDERGRARRRRAAARAARPRSRAEDAERAAHLALRLARARGDGVQRAGGGLRVGAPRRSARRRPARSRRTASARRRRAARARCGPRSLGGCRERRRAGAAPRASGRRAPRRARMCTTMTSQASHRPDSERSSKCSAKGTVPASVTREAAAASLRGAYPTSVYRATSAATFAARNSSTSEQLRAAEQHDGRERERRARAGGRRAERTAAG